MSKDSYLLINSIAKAILYCVENSGKKNQAQGKPAPEILSVGYKFYNLRID